MSRVFHRRLDEGLPMAAGGDGAYLIDDQGRRYLDASGGAAVSCLGHSDPDISGAVTRQLATLAYAHTAFFTNAPAERLAETLATAAPGDLDRVYFVSGGSEAIEAALMMARQYFLEIGQPRRARIIARRQSYHGNTLGALAVGGNPWRRAQFEPLLIDVSHIAPCNAYRGQRDGESAETYGRRAADELEQAIIMAGPDTVAAFVAETVAGATGGAVPPVPGYFRRIRDICDRHGVLLILDEVMCGMGRTGTLFACEQEQVVPDLLALAKGLGAGYQPIGALLVSERVYQAFASGSGHFQHGHTFMGHTAACAAGLAVLEAIARRDLLKAVRQRGAQLDALLRQDLGSHPHVGDIRGRGLFLAVELVADRAAKTPFDPALRLHARIRRHALARGLLVYPLGGTVDGRHGDHVLLAPPFIVTAGQVEEIAGGLSAAIQAAVAEIRP